MGTGDALDVRRVAGIIETQFPHLGTLSVLPLGEGCDSIAFLVNDTWVFRFPKRAEVERQLAVEARILPVLATTAPLPIPVFCFHGLPSATFRRPFAGYARLPGVPGIQWEPANVPFHLLAPKLARFLSWLHAFSVDEAIRCGVPQQPIAARLDEIRAEAIADFESVRKVAPEAPLEAWHHTLQSGCDIATAPRALATLVHNDLAAEHILLDPATQSITGIVDWSDIAIGDPAADLAGVFHWGGEALVQAVLATYVPPIDAGVMSRARFLGACRGVADVTFGRETGRQEYVRAGIRALGLCAGAVHGERYSR